MDQNNKNNRAFITKWRIGNNKILTLPLIETGSYDFIVNWGDSSPIEHITRFEASHLYSFQGIYQVSIIGTIVGWKATDTPEYNLLDVSQWGCLKLGNSGYYFYKCREMDITATDAPELSETNNLEYMFGYCRKFNGNIGHWDVSKITNMSYMFYKAYWFNQPIGKWDVSNVTDMERMFFRASSFNQDISKWNVSNVKNMEGMFSRTLVFNIDINNWDVSRVKNMNSMFEYASLFNQDISQWDVSHVTIMGWMFHKASAFNQNISNWNVLRVNDMNRMFYGAFSFNQDISRWDVSNVKNMNYMFVKARSFIKGPYLQELENWNVSRPNLLDTLLGFNKSFPHSPNPYLMNWNKWVNNYPTRISTEYTCSICLTDISVDDNWRAISCPATMTEGIPHCFHKKCIVRWVNVSQGSYTCPVCRRSVIAIK